MRHTTNLPTSFCFYAFVSRVTATQEAWIVPYPPRVYVHEGDSGPATTPDHADSELVTARGRII